MAADVTVAIPVYNGEAYLEEVLIAVRDQQVAADVELLIIDSGSTDNSLDIAESHNARIHRIPNSEFSHGGTRNVAVELAGGEHIAFLTQDATPAHSKWLQALLDGFDQAENVALVFGPHHARPDASHMIKAEMERHFATWNHGREIHVHRLEKSPQTLAEYRDFPGRWTFFSDVNGCVAKWAWKKIPYRPVPYAEDQLLGREMIEAGYAKVFHPEAAVIHSHHYSPARFFQRYFDEFRSLREVLGHVEVAHPIKTPMTIRGLTGHDKRWLRNQGVAGKHLVKPLAVSLRHHTLRQAGAIMGTRSNRLPSVIRRRLSLEGRASFEPYEVPASPLLETKTQADSHVVKQTSPWTWQFIADSYPSRSVVIDETNGRPRKPWTIAWVVPPWSPGSGGHTTIFRLIRQLELRGHKNAIFVFDPKCRNQLAARDLREQIRTKFIPINAEVFVGLDDFDSADFAVATEWSTAFPVRDLPRCKEKIYLVQDHEPEFFATSAERIWAEETYGMGYRCIAYTPWMADILKEKYGIDAKWFECGTDLETFPFQGEEGRNPEIVAIYARRETERRAVDLAMAALAILTARRATIRPVLFGTRDRVRLPFQAEHLGVVHPTRLSELYRTAGVGLVFSLTTHSLVAQEMMASGLPVVELEGLNVSSALGESGDVVHLSPPRPDAIADAIENLIENRPDASAMALRARGFVEERTWEIAGNQVEAALESFAKTDANRAGFESLLT